MRAPTSYAGPRRKIKKPKQVSQSIEKTASTKESDVRKVLASKGSRIISVTGEDSVQSVVELLHEKRIGAVLVLDQAGDLEGILSERDIVRKLAGLKGDLESVSVKDLMTTNVQTCSPDDQLPAVLKMMTEGRFRHVPVLDNGTLVGVITIGDVVKQRLQDLESEALSIKQVIVG
ncbi:MAG: CBS domain-containing protein [Pseudomonadota bacterium]